MFELPPNNCADTSPRFFLFCVHDKVGSYVTFYSDYNRLGSEVIFVNKLASVDDVTN